MKALFLWFTLGALANGCLLSVSIDGTEKSPDPQTRLMVTGSQKSETRFFQQGVVRLCDLDDGVYTLTLEGDHCNRMTREVQISGDRAPMHIVFHLHRCPKYLHDFDAANFCYIYIRAGDNSGKPLVGVRVDLAGVDSTQAITDGDGRAVLTMQGGRTYGRIRLSYGGVVSEQDIACFAPFRPRISVSLRMAVSLEK